MPETTVSLRNVASRRKHLGEVIDVSFDIHKGECIALTGRTYSGIKELSAILSKRKEYKGYIMQKDRRQLKDSWSSYEAGILLIDQRLITTASRETVMDALVAISGQDRLYSLVDEDAITARFTELIRDMGINRERISHSVRISELSRKERIEFELLRCLYANADCILIEDIFRGISDDDLADIHELLKRIKDKGTAIVYIADEYFEKLEDLIDRMIILRHGTVSYVLYPEGKEGSFDRKKIMLASSGKQEEKKGTPVKKERSGSLKLKIEQEGRELSFYSGDRIGLYDPAMMIPYEYKSLAVYLLENGRLYLNDEKLELQSMQDFLDSGIVVIHKDPDRELFRNFSPIQNVTLISGKRNSKTLTNDRVDRYIYKETCERYQYLKRCLSFIDHKNCYELPGNILKDLVVAKWLSLGPDIVVFFDLEDTYQPAEQEHCAQLFRQLSEEGKIVISVSSNLDFLEKTSETIIS